MPSTPPIRNSSREPHLLRFRLWQMFAFVAFCSVLLTLMRVTGGQGPIVIGVLTLLGAAHVVGNLIGTRLRDSSQEVSQWRAEQRGREDLPSVPDLRETRAQLEMRTKPPLAGFDRVNRWVVWLVIGGIACGAVFGGIVLGVTFGSSIGWAGWAVGVVSCAVLGAWAAFLASNFSLIARHAWRDAHGKKS